MQTRRNPIGQVVVATLVDLVSDSIYKMRAVVENGDLKGREILVAHKGTPHIRDRKMIVRLDTPSPKSKMNLDGIAYTGYFVSSDIPDGFDFALPNDIVMYGFWDKQMKEGYAVPFTTRVSDFYYFGTPVNLLYLLPRSGFIFTLYLQQHMKVRGASRMCKDLSESIGLYLLEMERELPECARVVLIDEEIDFRQDVMPHFDKIKHRYGKRFIEMEPQW